MTWPCLGGWLLMSKSPPSSLPAALRDLVFLAHWYAVISATGKPFCASSIAGCSRSDKVTYQKTSTGTINKSVLLLLLVSWCIVISQ